MLMMSNFLCPACRAILAGVATRRYSSTRSSFEPGSVLVVPKRSRLDYERSRGNVSDDVLKSQLSEIGSDYQKLVDKHRVHQRSIDQVLHFLESEGVPHRVKSRDLYTTEDVEWADTILSLGGDGNFLFTASKVLSPRKLVIGLNTDPLSSEGYLCLPSSPEVSLPQVMSDIFRGRIPKTYRARIRVEVGGQTLPVRALNEVYIGENNISQASSYELSYDGTSPERQKSSGVIIYTGTGSTSWAYNMNQVTRDQVASLVHLAKEEGLVKGSIESLAIDNITKTFNASNVFKGNDYKMAFVVREPIVRGLFAALRTRGFTQRMDLRSRSWYSCVIIDGDFQYDFPRGAMATCSLHKEDLLTTLDTTRSNDCFS